MRVRLLTDRVGFLFYESAGDIVDVEDEEAWRLIGAKQAEIVGPETTAVEPARAAVLDRPQFRRNRK